MNELREAELVRRTVKWEHGQGERSHSVTQALIGIKGAVVFTVMYPDGPLDEDMQRINDDFAKRLGRPLWPLAADVGFHSREPMHYHERTDARTDCEFLNGADCYYDGSSLHAQRLWDTLQGLPENAREEFLWTYLRNYYHEVFYGDD